jgi:pre-mRNA-splicing helicase BRR2
MEMDDGDRNKLLKMPIEKLTDVARVANQYPNVTLNATVLPAAPGEDIEVDVTLTREDAEDETVPTVQSAYFPEEKPECWWIVVGDSEKNKLFALRRVTFAKELETRLKLKSPEPGRYTLLVYLISDSYIGCDHQSDEIPLEVAADDN